jgi:hypothetical protein
MRTAKQLSVPLVNRPGRLAAVLESLAKEKAHALALSVMDTGTQATLRLIPDDLDAAVSALKMAGVKFVADDVLLLEANHRTGGMQKICRRLAEEHLNIDYVYAALGASGNKTSNLVVIRVNDLAKAQRVLSESASPNGERPKKRPTRRPTFVR